MFAADLLIGHGTSDSYAFGFGIRVGARVTPAARNGFIVGARGVWHSGDPFLAFETLGGSAVRTEVDRRIAYYAAELGPVWFHGDGGLMRIRLVALVGYAHVSTRKTFGSPPIYAGEWNDSALLGGAGIDLTVRVSRMSLGAELGFIRTSDLGSVFIYGHIGGLWDG